MNNKSKKSRVFEILQQSKENVEDYKKYFNLLNFKIFKLDDNTSQNNFILYDIEKKEFWTEISLIMMFDILKEKRLNLFFDILVQEIFFENKKLFNNVDENQKKELLIRYQKPFFQIYKNLVLLYKVNVKGFDIIPESKLLINKSDGVYLNLFKPVIDFTTIKATTKRDFYHIETLLKNILGVGYEHFLKLIAWKIQNPTEIISNHWIIQDDGGTGKTEFLANDILDKIFPVSIIGQAELENNFTYYLKNTMFIIAEEIEGYSNEKKIKQLTGSKKINIRELYKNGYNVTNYNNWIILSNDIKPLKITIEDRRFNVVGGGIRLAPLKDGDWSKTLFKTKENNIKFFDNYHKNIKQERINLIAYLKSLKLNRVELQQTLNTKQKKDLQEINFTSEFVFFEELENLGIDNIINEYLNKSPTQFLKNNIINKDDGVWIKSSALFFVYVDYCQACNLKPIGKSHFFRRAYKVKYFNDLFIENKIISYDNNKFMALKINSNKK